MTAQEALQDGALQSRIDKAAERSLDWLAAREVAAGAPAGVMAFAPQHDTAKWPGMLLPGTYNGVMCRHLLGGLTDRPGSRSKHLQTGSAGLRARTARSAFPA